jgi:signal transduction histidine kinase/GAF domain-containing protein
MMTWKSEPNNPSRNTGLIEKVLAEGGEMGILMQSINWTETALGPIEHWPQSLKTTVSTCLASHFPILIWWGPDLIKIYNDAYRPILGSSKHPAAMGRPGREVWPEIWHIIGPMLEGVLQRGEATWSKDQMLPLDRYGFTEECYFTFSYSPIRDESGNVGGVFTAVTETTERVLSERRLSTLRELGTRTVQGETAEEVCLIAAEALTNVPEDVPFALFYLLDAAAEVARLVCCARVETGAPICPERIDLADTTRLAVWPLAEVATSREQLVVNELQNHFGDLSAGAWPEAIRTARILPLMSPGLEQCMGFLVVGVSPRLHFDEEYAGFFTLTGKHVETAIANARAHEMALQRAEALAELNRAKTVFFNNVSHEFRTPLTLILGPLEDLLSNIIGDLAPGQRTSLDMIYRNSLRLLKLVNSLLDFSRMEAGRIDISFVPVDLAMLTTDLASMFRAATERAGLQFKIDCPSLPEPIYVDQEMWEKIVLNLLSNAFKFTFEGEIEVALRPFHDHVELTVRDTGVGIPPDELPLIFTRFHRVRDARSRTFEGSGIGLSLVQDLTHQHKGTITVESQVGQGTTFTVSIPRGTAHLPQDRIGAQRTLASTSVGAIAYVEEALRWLPDLDQAGVTPTENTGSDTTANLAESAPANTAGTDFRIMVVDDNADMRDYLVRLLTPHYAVEACPDGAAALIAAQENPPNLILCDVMMPGLNGFEVLMALRENASLSAIPVILLSARAGEEATVEGLEAGANDYLIKPFSVPELLARIHTQIEMARLRDQLVEQSAQLAKIDERQQLARDLHDSVNQTLFSASIIAQSLPATWQRDPTKVLPHLTKLDQLTRSAMAEMRTLLFQLRPSGMENAKLSDLLILLVAAFRGRSTIDIALNMDSQVDQENLPLEVRHNFYRIAQEGLNNIVKHSGANRVEINFEDTSRATTIRIHDDGNGFDPLAPAVGMGLKSMHERAESVGASFTITSEPGQGTEILLERLQPA